MLLVHSEGLNLKQCNYGFVIKYVYTLTGWTRFKEYMGLWLPNAFRLLQFYYNNDDHSTDHIGSSCSY